MEKFNNRIGTDKSLLAFNVWLRDCFTFQDWIAWGSLYKVMSLPNLFPYYSTIGIIVLYRIRRTIPRNNSIYRSRNREYNDFFTDEFLTAPAKENIGTKKIFTHIMTHLVQYSIWKIYIALVYMRVIVIHIKKVFV